MKEQYNKYLDNINERLCGFLPPETLPQGEVIKASLYSLGAGGKRIRPVLCLAFCEMCGGKAENAIAAACAVEYVHTYSLIHDDLPCMDNDDLRRGKPSCHKAFGEGTALLAGDALLTHSFGIIADCETLSPGVKVKCISALSRLSGTTGMIGGQQIDTENDGKNVDQDNLLLMYSMKTSALLQAACLCGIYCAESKNEAAYIQAAEKYALELGLAFQIQDDILDVVSTSEELGKPIGSDAASDKRTYVSLYGLDKAREAAREHTQKALCALETFDNTEFLSELTKTLLGRKK